MGRAPFIAALRRTVQRPVNVRYRDAEHLANLRLALALNPQIANLPLGRSASPSKALRSSMGSPAMLPLPGAILARPLGDARRGRWQAFQGGAVSLCAPATKRAS